MIVTEDGARYEPPKKNLKLGKDTALLVLLSAEGTSYPYYLLEDQFLFCPNGQ
jgi:hypothetical protein